MLRKEDRSSGVVEVLVKFGWTTVPAGSCKVASEVGDWEAYCDCDFVCLPVKASHMPMLEELSR